MRKIEEYLNRHKAAGKSANRLISEKSPYLLQHAYNPVDWYPWGDAAFQAAQEQDKPVFMSIGYATCHWCHVMEHESFENAEIAAVMNDLFINIKVDREERPDVDRVYMNAVQAMIRHGGWPLSVFLTHDRKPFYGGTYFPPQSKYGQPGFVDLLQQLHKTWQNERAKIHSFAVDLTKRLQESFAGNSKAESLQEDALHDIFEAFAHEFDGTEGGFGQAPKFPRPVVLKFLMHYGQYFNKPAAFEMVRFTLKKMMHGGMYDHLGGGFSRYSVDRLWRVPHFEKMLYDQAQLVTSYLDAWQQQPDDGFEQTIIETCEYVLHEMTAPEGGFYSAEDADSAADAAQPDVRTEGAYYMWTQEELFGALDREQAEIAAFAYGVEPGGNTISDPHGEFGSGNVLYRRYSPHETAARFKRTEADIMAILLDAKSGLKALQIKRPRPLLDDKIIAGWNGLMVSALARAGDVLQRPDFIQAAKKAADFLHKTLYDASTGALLRRYRDGESRHPGHLEDYAFVCRGLLDLYEATADGKWLQRSQDMLDQMMQKFYDDDAGLFYDTASDDGELLFRSRDFYDGAEPAGTSVAVHCLQRLGHVTGRAGWLEAAVKVLQQRMSMLREMPTVAPLLAQALFAELSAPPVIVIAGSAEDPATIALRQALRSIFIPIKAVLYADGSQAFSALAKEAPWLQGMGPVDGKPAAYVCRNFSCELPVTEPEALIKLFQQEKKQTA